MEDIKTADCTNGPALLFGNKKVSAHAYVFSVFKDSSYLLGALAAAFSIKQTNSQNDVVLMVTEVPEDMISIAKAVFDRIYSVPYLQVEARPLRTEKQRARYESWMNIACTKWNCLALTDYKTVMFVDADKIILSNLDHLFNLPTPAGTFSSPQAKGYCKNGGMYNPYLRLREGDRVHYNAIAEGLDGCRGTSFTAIGTMLTLTPSASDYSEFKSMLQLYSKEKPFGYPTCNSSIDEQAIVHFYSRHLSVKTEKNIDWTYISQQHQWICWKPEWLRKGEFPPTVIHYFGLKAWKMDRADWLDLQPWWAIVKLMLQTAGWDEQTRKQLEELYRKDQLEMRGPTGCFYCKLLAFHHHTTHAFMAADGKIECPLWNEQKKSSPPLFKGT